MELPDIGAVAETDFKRVSGGLLLQDKDLATLDEKCLKVVTKKKPTKKEMEALIFAWKVAKHVKSNAIILTRGRKTVGIGAGQMSRVDSVFIATKKSGKLAAGSVLASDAFFPKEDAIQLAAKYKIKAIIQPGGSVCPRCFEFSTSTLVQSPRRSRASGRDHRPKPRDTRPRPGCGPPPRYQ